MPWNAPDGDEAGVFRSPCASNHTTASRSPCAASAASTGARSTAQSPPTVSTVRPRARALACAARTAVRFVTRVSRAATPSRGPDGSPSVSTRTRSPAGNSPASSAAPCRSRYAPREPDPCHCGTSRTVTPGISHPPLRSGVYGADRLNHLRSARTQPDRLLFLRGWSDGRCGGSGSRGGAKPLESPSGTKLPGMLNVMAAVCAVNARRRGWPVRRGGPRRRWRYGRTPRGDATGSGAARR